MTDEKKVKKLAKAVEGTVLTITEGETGTVLRYDFNDMPEAIRINLGVHGLSQKLGDAAAGKRGQEAIDSITKVAEGLANGDWTTRAPAAEKVTKKSILEKFEAMPEGPEKEMAKTLLSNLGILKG